MRTTLILAFVLLAASCGGAADDTPEPAGLDGTNWILGDLILDGAPRPLAGTIPTLRFDAAGEAGGTNGCNSYGGSVSFDGESIAFGDLFATEIGCQPPQADMERDFMMAIRNVDVWSRNGDALVLSASDGSAVMSFVAPAAVVDRDLAGSWRLETIGDFDVVMSTIAGSEATLEIAGGDLTGSTGCNSLSGTLTAGDRGSFAVTELTWTEIGCELDIMSQEASVLERLQDAVRYEIEGDRLTISTTDGRFLRYGFVER